MKTVVLDVQPFRRSLGDFSRAWKSGKRNGAYRISFATPELLWKVLTEKRWAILKAMAGAGPMTIREAARRVTRDIKAVHGDVRALLNAGVLWKTDDGLVEFPFDAVRVDFTLQAA